MSNRWGMNRIGFINFWLYDEEIFEFEKGKLLLRGQNASGKSITTQSILPFILDGDRTPSRLDTFGSNDRKMEYYFLGEDGREESTGYLFLELKKTATDQYRTLVIGQRARRGAAMTFWGFVLLDGRRVGYDLHLYKEVGNTKLPYSRQEIKKILGPDVPFTDSPGEYKELVNKYIFGFRRTEQYEQLTQLLVNVRGSKLSKEFKPTKIYDILNNSLQTLTDEDLRAMVDAMEKMDSIQINLDHLKSARRDAQIIQNEYTRYNQFMLGRKAGSYLEANARVEKQKAQLEAEEERQKFLEESEKETSQSKDETAQKLAIIRTDLDSLKGTDLDAVTKELLENREKEKGLGEERQRWEEKAESARENLLELDRKLREYKGNQELLQDEIQGEQGELEEIQETLQFADHQKLHKDIWQLTLVEEEEVSTRLREWKQKIHQGLGLLKEQEELKGKYDQAAQEASRGQAKVVEREMQLEVLAEREEKERDGWIEKCYELPGKNRELIPKRHLLEELQKEILAYQGIKDQGKISRLWEQCRDQRRRELQDLKNQSAQEIRELSLKQIQKREELSRLQKQKDWEPNRTQVRINSRERLKEAGISWIPFYQAFEFAPQVADKERNLLEEQLKEAGVLDALVVERRHWDQVRSQFPEYADVMICAPERESGPLFEKLIPEEDLPEGLKKETLYILRAISQETVGGLFLKADGFFRNGLLEGRSLGEEESSLIGQLTRRRRLEQQMELLEKEHEILEREERQREEKLSQIKEQMAVLEQEFVQIPKGDLLEGVLAEEKQCLWYLEQEKKELARLKKEEERLKLLKNECFQKVLRMGRELPYARTCEAYEEAETAAEEYLETWRRIGSRLQRLRHYRELLKVEREKGRQYEENQETAIAEVKEREKRLELLRRAIHNGEEFLNRPENRELAGRLGTLREQQRQLGEKLRSLENEWMRLEIEKNAIVLRLKEKKAELSQEIQRETELRTYFEEELELGLVIERDGRSLKACGEEAQKHFRDGDRNREASDMTASLLRVYQKNSASLINYGTSMEDCFSQGTWDGQALRKRQQIVSMWNGRKLYFAQFCQTLKSSIEETELLIQEKDRELFENILSRTLSQQLTDRIEESRQWIQSMSGLMKGMDTSMGLSFSLDWKPKAAQSDQEIDTVELEKLLRRDQRLLTLDDVERVAGHFRNKIRQEKQRLEETGGPVNYMELVRDALDYRKWFEFQMSFYRNQEGKKPLTNAAFNKFSGGEKAMAMYVPLFAAVNAQYLKSSKEDCPRIIALDEAFAGVDDKNISSMFQLVGTLDFDYIMNSQALWGCYDSVPALRISELYRPADAQVVTVIHYTWNGHERKLDEQ
ncbi:MAG: TIGR02680 family protein [Lachnospiraceae bacterium]|nr:TIGR02680 family protein [Lachnospiraceae bacterium]